MDYRIRKHLPHGRPDWIDDRNTLFVTLCHKHRGVSHFNCDKAWMALVHAAEHLSARGKWAPLLMLAMPDHLHALVRIPREQDIGKVIGRFKRTTSMDTRPCGRRTDLITVYEASPSIWPSVLISCKTPYAPGWSADPMIGRTGSRGNKPIIR